MQTKILLDEDQMPKKWYNVQADLKSPLDPPLHPKTQKPIGPEDLSAIFPMELIRQEVTTDRNIAIPEEVQEVMRLWRPSPLYRAHRLEKFLKTPAKIYYKWEGVSPAAAAVVAGVAGLAVGAGAMALRGMDGKAESDQDSGQGG